MRLLFFNTHPCYSSTPFAFFNTHRFIQHPSYCSTPIVLFNTHGAILKRVFVAIAVQPYHAPALTNHFRCISLHRKPNKKKNKSYARAEKAARKARQAKKK